jgi:hypothetical protein
MTKFHNGFSESGNAREKLKYINTWINRLKETQYTPHPFEILGITKHESSLSSLSETTRQNANSAN